VRSFSLVAAGWDVVRLAVGLSSRFLLLRLPQQVQESTINRPNDKGKKELKAIWQDMTCTHGSQSLTKKELNYYSRFCIFSIQIPLEKVMNKNTSKRRIYHVRPRTIPHTII
jgi:hypothetical protein